MTTDDRIKMSAHVPAVHATRYSLEPSDAGYIWRCDCGALGYGLASSSDASREALRHLADEAAA